MAKRAATGAKKKLSATATSKDAGKSAQPSNAVFMRRVVLFSALGVVVAGLVIGLVIGLRGLPGRSNGDNTTPTCTQGGQPDSVKSGPATWEGNFAAPWTIAQPQTVTITPVGGPSGGTLAVVATPVSLNAGSTIHSPPAITLRFANTLTPGPKYTVSLALPVPGCWKLTAQLQSKQSSIFVRASAPAGASGCPASQVARPAAPGVEAEFGGDPVWWRTTPPYSSVLPVTVILRVTNGYQTDPLQVSAAQLSDHGQRFDVTANAVQLTSPDPGNYYLVTFSIPASGCWLLSAHAGPSDGVIVVEVG